MLILHLGIFLYISNIPRGAWLAEIGAKIGENQKSSFVQFYLVSYLALKSGCVFFIIYHGLWLKENEMCSYVMFLCFFDIFF